MVERSGFSVYFSTDLRQKVSDWADNSTSSQADILDKALEDFFDSHEISEDGTIVSKDANRRADGASVANVGDGGLEEVIENQEEMLELLRGGHGASAEDSADIISEPDEESSEDESNVPATTDASEVEEQIASLAGEYNHDECIEPDEVAALDVRESDVVKQTQQHLIPAVAGMVNYRYEQGEISKWVTWSEIEELIVGVLGMSKSSARNYREEMVRRGVIHPHPSIDDRVVGDSMVGNVRTAAAGVTSDHPVNSTSDISNPARYPEDVSEYIGEYVREWEHDEYCISDGEYVAELWRIAGRAAEQIAIKQPGESRARKSDMADVERLRGAYRVVVELNGILGEHGVVDSGRFGALLARALKVDSEDDMAEWMGDWAPFAAEVNDRIGGDGGDDDLGEGEAREVLGVDEGATEEEILEAYEAYVMENHPDADGSDEEIDTGEFHEVLKAKRVLTA